MMVLLAAITVLSTVLLPGQPASGQVGANPEPDTVLEIEVLEIEGGGWGHGRGMGQYGAEGYARRGWSSKQILDHFYSNTTQGTAPANLSFNPGRMRVDLQFMGGRSLTAALAAGSIAVVDGSGSSIAEVTAGAVRIERVGDGFQISTSANCRGPWADSRTVSTSAVTLRALPTGRVPGNLAGEPHTLLKVCGSSYDTWYGGELRTVVSGGRQRTVNIVSIEEYLRGVVPNEMPASWSRAALESQSVAARSYALAGDTRWRPWADTCDTIWCQVYDGRYTTRGSGSVRASTHERTDSAIAATSGQVRLRPNATVARTEFSSSTGGYTAGGDFPAVKDEGDSVEINPNARWTKSVSSTVLERRYGLGTLTGAEVVSRNGSGPWGGRVTALRLDFANGTRTLSGDQARRALGLKSNLFNVEVAGLAPEVDEAELERRRTEISMLTQRIIGRAPTTTELSAAMATYTKNPNGGVAVVTQLVGGDDFARLLVDDLYQRAFGRQPADSGLRYWSSRLKASDRGVETAGTLFFASPEYYRRAGGTDEAFVTALYNDVLGRPPADSGLAHWAGRLTSGSASRVTVAGHFFGSYESRRIRASDLHRRILGERPSAADARVGAGVVADQGDRSLAEQYGRTLIAS